MSSERNPDVLVLGGGVIGLACAYYLLRAGRTVTLLERGRIGAGSSHGNCGTLTPSHMPLTQPGQVGQALKWMLRPGAPLLVRPTLDPVRIGWLLKLAGHCNAQHLGHVLATRVPLLQASRRMIEDLVRTESLDCEFENLGTLYVFRDEAKFAQLREQLPRLRDLGLEARELDGAATQEFEPSLLPGAAGSVLNPGDAHLRPDRFVAELARRVRELGATVVEDCEVTGLREENGKLAAVASRNDEYAGNDVVLALGAWSPGLARSAGLGLPIQPGKGYSITYSRPTLVPRRPLVLKEAGVCVTAWTSGYRLASTLEFAGHDTTLNPVRLQALEHGAQAYLRDPVGPQVVERWYGWRPMTPDELPIIGRAPAVKNLWLATGHGMLGMSLSAVTGQLITELLTRKPPSFDPAPFSPARFA